MLSLKQVEFKVVQCKMAIIDQVKKEKTSQYKPRGLRWSGVKPQEERKPLSNVIDIEKSYNQWLYSYLREEIYWYLERIYHFTPTSCLLRPTLLPSKVEGGQNIFNYTQRILRQFGSNQEAIQVVGDDFISVWEAKSQFMGDDIEYSSQLHFVLVTQCSQRGRAIIFRCTFLDEMHRGA